MEDKLQKQSKEQKITLNPQNIPVIYQLFTQQLHLWGQVKQKNLDGSYSQLTNLQFPSIIVGIIFIIISYIFEPIIHIISQQYNQFKYSHIWHAILLSSTQRDFFSYFLSPLSYFYQFYVLGVFFSLPFLFLLIIIIFEKNYLLAFRNQVLSLAYFDRQCFYSLIKWSRSINFIQKFIFLSILVDLFQQQQKKTIEIKSSHVSKYLPIKIQNSSRFQKSLSKVVCLYIYNHNIFCIYKIIIEVMLSTELIEHIFQIRRTDNDSGFHSIYAFQANEDQYFQHLQGLLEEAERLQLKNTTKYLAKKYFDILMLKYPLLFQSDPILILVSCLRTALKFNETVEFSENFTLEFWIAQTGGKYSLLDINNCEMLILRCLSFKLRMTSPYQFIVTKSLLPSMPKSMKIVDSIIDFALTLPQIKNASAQGIFFGSLLYACRQKNQGEQSANYINAITYKAEQANLISIILKQRLQSIISE